MVQDFKMIRKTYAEISLQNLRHNYSVLRGLNPSISFFCPMLKTSAYGHGDIPVAKTLSKLGCHFFGVALVEEAIALREAGIDDASLLIFGPFGQEALSYVEDHLLTPVVSVMEQLRILIESQIPLNIHIKINTGMNRLGFDEEEWDDLLSLIQSNPQLRLEGVCTHLAAAEDFFSDNSFTQLQFKKFNDFINKIPHPRPPYLHILNSAGWIANYLATDAPQAWGVRPGIALYGVKPLLRDLTSSQQEKWQSINLKPVMTLKSEIIAYHHVKKGEKVSYGGHWIAPRHSIIGVIPIGYGDGYHRLFSQQGIVMYRKHKVPVVGTVCMDYIMVDLTEAINSPPVWREEVVFFGENGQDHLAVEEVAQLASTISYELLTGIGKRVPRKYVE